MAARKHPVRWNVLLLVGIAYASALTIFAFLVLRGNMPVDEAYDVIEGPFMALIGGSLAIAKDLVSADAVPTATPAALLA